MAKDCCGPGYASPAEAIKAPREKLLYTIAIYTGTGIQKPDYLATIDVDPESSTYSQVIHRLEMPGIGDELHHMGWNACSSCHHDGSMSRRYLLVPGVRSNNIHIVDTATDPRAPRLHKVIDGSEIKAKVDLSGPHTVHCLGSEIIISFLGNAKGEAPGGYLHLNKNFEIVGRWESSMGDIPFGYDFWYQPRHNVMVSSEWAAPNTFMPGFDLEEVGHLKYGRRLHFWDFEKREPIETKYLGEDGLIPLEVKFHHNPDSTHGFCGAALASNVIHFWKSDAGKWEWEKIVDVDNEPHPEWPIPVPGVMSAILVSMDDRYLYLNNWLHGDMRQYDISDPHHPKLTGQVWMGGLLGRAPVINGAEVAGGPQMFQLSLDGRRLYATTSLFSTWDNQFYPEIREKGGVMIMIDCDPENGGMKINEDFIIDFGKEPNGPSRCHETRYPGGDCTSDNLAMTTRTVTIANRDNARYEVDARRPLLDALREQGVDLPYGCKYGGCITCAAKLTAGAVDQRRQVALNNRQIANGYVILCVARATSDITLEIGVESHEKLYRNPFLDPLAPHELKADIATPKEI